MTALRAKYIRDLAIRGRALRTQQSYTSYVADLAGFYDRSPDMITYEEVIDWIHHLIRERHLAASSVNIAVNAVRFLYGVTLHRDIEALMAAIPHMKRNTGRSHPHRASSTPGSGLSHDRLCRRTAIVRSHPGSDPRH